MKAWLPVICVAIGCGTMSPDPNVCNQSCDDGIACTEDRCTNGTCQIVARDQKCLAGYGCDPSRGCVARYGLSDDQPGMSCVDILAVLTSAPDGAYWIDLDGGAPDNAFEAYCDMTAGGGGWMLVYKYVGSDSYSPNDILATTFAGPRATTASLATERGGAINRRVYDALWAARGPCVDVEVDPLRRR